MDLYEGDFRGYGFVWHAAHQSSQLEACEFNAEW